MNSISIKHPLATHLPTRCCYRCRAQSKSRQKIYIPFIFMLPTSNTYVRCACALCVCLCSTKAPLQSASLSEKKTHFFSFRVFPNLFPFAPFTIQPFPFADKFNLIPRVAVMRVCSVWCGVGVLEACF